MVTDVLGALGQVRELGAVAVVTARAARTRGSGRGGGRGAGGHSSEAGQSAAALIGIRHALAAGYERALLVPGDTPLLDPRR